MRSDSTRARVLIKLYLSFFSLSKVIELAPKVSKKTFDSILTPCSDYYAIYAAVKEVLSPLPSLVCRYIPKIRDPSTSGDSLRAYMEVFTIFRYEAANVQHD